MQEISGLAEIVDEFDAFAIDQFGVLHDGQAPYDGALATLQNLAKYDRPVVALTNSGKRSALNLDRLERLGFAQNLFHALISSGELAYDHIQQLQGYGKIARDAAVLLVSRQGDTSIIEGLNLRHVTHGEVAELVIIAGADPEHRELDYYRDLLRSCATAGVPALLVNPDTHMATVDGPRFGPGQIASAYEKMGGPLTILGKPARHMFDTALRKLGQTDPRRVLMIGDSPAHDIAGAKSAGLSTLLIKSGLQNSTPGPDADYCMLNLCW